MYKTPFKDPTHFKPSSYDLLPFEYENFKGDKVIITNMLGEYLLIKKAELELLVGRKLEIDSELYRTLKRKYFLYDSTDSINTIIDLISLRYRTKHQSISDFTGLHIFVVSLRCEHTCHYCQVSRQNVHSLDFDMSTEVALKALDMVFKSPSHYLKIEFQGGEPLLNFNLIKFIVQKALERNLEEKRDLSFVIATNLALVTDEILEFCQENNILISTSMDGPDYIHNKNRYRPGNNSHQKAIEGIKKVREKLGHDKVGALMTTSVHSIDKPIEIINEYLNLGFDSIFLRPISPYGFAVKGNKNRNTVDEWLEFYFKGLDYIIELNLNGIRFREDYASIVLNKIIGKKENGYVDLQNPSGIGISAVVYNYDGKLYASDEGRMLKEMGQEVFCLGSFVDQSYEELLGNDSFLNILSESLLDSSPDCYQCGFKEFCGSDPVYHFATQGDFVGDKSKSDFCQRNMSIFKTLIDRYENEPEVRKVFESWL